MDTSRSGQTKALGLICQRCRKAFASEVFVGGNVTVHLCHKCAEIVEGKRIDDF